MNIAYSFGGTRDAPLVQRVVEYSRDPLLDDQANLLARTDAILTDMCLVFDGARVAFDTSAADDVNARLEAVDIMMGVVKYAVMNIILLSPSAKYIMFEARMQQLAERVAGLDAGVQAIVREVLQPVQEAIVFVRSACVRSD